MLRFFAIKNKEKQQNVSEKSKDTLPSLSILPPAAKLKKYWVIDIKLKVEHTITLKNGQDICPEEFTEVAYWFAFLKSPGHILYHRSGSYSVLRDNILYISIYEAEFWAPIEKLDK
jgi:hypothetical protein